MFVIYIYLYVFLEQVENVLRFFHLDFLFRTANTDRYYYFVSILQYLAM